MNTTTKIYIAGHKGMVAQKKSNKLQFMFGRFKIYTIFASA